MVQVLRAGQEPHIIVISQFRPPLANHCLEVRRRACSASGATHTTVQRVQ